MMESSLTVEREATSYFPEQPTGDRAYRQYEHPDGDVRISHPLAGLSALAAASAPTARGVRTSRSGRRWPHLNFTMSVESCGNLSYGVSPRFNPLIGYQEVFHSR